MDIKKLRQKAAKLEGFDPEELKRLQAEVKAKEKEIEASKARDRENFIQQMLVEGKIFEDQVPLLRKLLLTFGKLDKKAGNGEGVMFYVAGKPTTREQNFRNFVSSAPFGACFTVRGSA